MRPMLATRGTHVPTGDEWQHEVKWDGMRVLVDVQRRRGAAVQPQRERRDRVLPRARRGPAARRRPAGRRGGGVRGRRAELRGPGRADARLPRRSREAHWPSASRSPCSSSTCSASLGVTCSTSRSAYADRCSRSSTSSDDRWQTPPAYDDGQMLFDATLPAGTRGHRQQARHQPLPAGPAQQGLAEVRPPPSRVVTSSVAGDRETDSQDRLGAVLVGEPTRRRSALPRSRRQRHRRPEGRRAPRGAGRSRSATPARSSTRCRGSTPWVRRGSSRSWSSTSSPSARRPRAASASRRTSASVPT